MTPSLELAHHVLPESIDRTLAGECHQRDLARLPGLEAHRGAGRDVEPHAARLGAVKLQRRIGLEEMIVRAHLDRPVAGIRHRQGDGLAAGIELDLAVLDEGFAGNHWLPHVFRCAQAAPLAPPLPACARLPGEKLGIAALHLVWAFALFAVAGFDRCRFADLVIVRRENRSWLTS